MCALFAHLIPTLPPGLSRSLVVTSLLIISFHSSSFRPNWSVLSFSLPPSCLLAPSLPAHPVHATLITVTEILHDLPSCSPGPLKMIYSAVLRPFPCMLTAHRRGWDDDVRGTDGRGVVWPCTSLPICHGVVLLPPWDRAAVDGGRGVICSC